jgi:hypothetical protein
MTFRVRAMSATGDMTFGSSKANFLIDSPQAVGQLVKTRLLLWEGEWFLNLSEGTPWFQNILGKSSESIRDAAIQNRIANTPFVTGILSYASQVLLRNLTITATLATAFGQTNLNNVPVYPPGGNFLFGQSPLGGFGGLG